MKKGDLKNIISSIGKEKNAYHCSYNGDVYLSEGHFILKTTDKLAQYVIDKVNEKKRRPEWSELRSLPNFFTVNGELCKKIESGELSNGRSVLFLKQEDYMVTINKKFTIDGGNFYTVGERKQVIEFIDSEGILCIMPIVNPERKNNDQV